MATLKPQSNGPICFTRDPGFGSLSVFLCFLPSFVKNSNAVIGTLAVDGWAVTFGTAKSGLGGLGPNETAHPSTASVPTSYYLTWDYNCLWTLKG